MSELTYEQKQAQLEEIVAKLESGNAPLEEMIRLYEQGEALYRDCAATLDAYEKRLNDLEKEQA
jgi:exodeoxyribonuclease VII small subunit